MFKNLVLCLMLVLFPCTTMAYDYEEPDGSKEDLLDHWYSEVCPYGDSVITDMDKKHVVDTSCVTYNYRTGMWDTWQGYVDRRHSFKSYDPKKYRIWVMDGEVILKNKHPEVVFYGVRTIDDPKFGEWIGSR